jgi:hypothetical protein
MLRRETGKKEGGDSEAEEENKECMRYKMWVKMIIVVDN